MGDGHEQWEPDEMDEDGRQMIDEPWHLVDRHDDDPHWDTTIVDAVMTIIDDCWGNTPRAVDRIEIYLDQLWGHR